MNKPHVAARRAMGRGGMTPGGYPFPDRFGPDEEVWKGHVELEQDDGGQEWLVFQGEVRAADSESEDAVRFDLEMFCGLEQASPQAILQYARKHGYLGVCGEHQLPAEHDGFRSCSFAVAAADSPFGESGRESLSAWRETARSVRALLHIAGCLHAEEVPPLELWDEVFDEQWQKVSGESWSHHFRSRLSDESDAASIIQFDRTRLAALLWGWVDATGVRLMPVWRSGEDFTLEFETQRGLLGRVARDLVLEVARVRAWAVCSGCGRLHARRNRRPARGRKAWCGREECQRAAAAEHKRLSRQRQRRRK